MVESLGKTLRLGVGVYALVLKGAYLYIELFNLAIYGRGRAFYETITVREKQNSTEQLPSS